MEKLILQVLSDNKNKITSEVLAAVEN